MNKKGLQNTVTRLHVVGVFIGLEMDAEVAFRRRRVVTDVAAIRFVAARVRLASRQPRVWSAASAVDTCRVAVWVFLSHVNLQRLLVLVVPVALGTLERLAGVTRHESGGRRRAERAADRHVEPRL